jgi:hypothetical protein
MGVRPDTDLPCQGSHGSSSRLGATRRPTTSSSSGVWAAAGPMAMEVDEKEEEAEALAERYALGGACKVLMGTPAQGHPTHRRGQLRRLLLLGEVNFAWERVDEGAVGPVTAVLARGPCCTDRFPPARRRRLSHPCPAVVGGLRWWGSSSSFASLVVEIHLRITIERSFIFR